MDKSKYGYSEAAVKHLAELPEELWQDWVEGKSADEVEHVILLMCKFDWEVLAER
jgi:capsid protein